MAEALRADRSSFAHLDDLVNYPLVRVWLYWGMFWLLVDAHGWRHDFGPVQLPRLPRHVRVSHLRAVAAAPRQWRDLRRLLGAVFRPVLLPGAAAVRGSCACRAPRLLDGVALEHRPRRRADLDAARLQPGARGERAALRGRHLPDCGRRNRDLAVHGHDRESRRAAALRQPLVSARHLLVDDLEYDPWDLSSSLTRYLGSTMPPSTVCSFIIL